MSPHATMQSFLAGMNYSPAMIEDRASAFSWLMDNMKPEEWPTYMDTHKTKPMCGNWCFVDATLPDSPRLIVFTNFIVPSITPDEFKYTMLEQELVK